MSKTERDQENFGNEVQDQEQERQQSMKEQIVRAVAHLNITELNQLLDQDTEHVFVNSIRDEDNNTLLIRACQGVSAGQTLQVVESLLEHKADVNAHGKRENTALHQILMYLGGKMPHMIKPLQDEAVSVAECLLRHKADVTALNSLGGGKSCVLLATQNLGENGYCSDLLDLITQQVQSSSGSELQQHDELQLAGESAQ